MNPQFYSLPLIEGIQSKGIVDMKVVPKDWLANKIVPDFATGKVLDQILLIPGKAWLSIVFLPKTYKLKEKSKTNKSGDYIETTATGTLNSLRAGSLQTLQNMKRYELVMLCMDKQKVKRCIGNNEHGMLLGFDHDHDSSSQQVELTFTFESEDSPPFYTPPNSSTGGKVLATEDGDILITEDGNQIEVE